MVDRLDRLGHDAVVGGDHEHRDVGRLRAAPAHRGERLVARRVDEGDDPAVLLGLVRTDVLGDPTGFARDHVRVADPVEQRRLAVVDVAHHGDDRRTGLEQRLVLVLVVVAEHRLELELLLLTGLDEEHLGAERLGDQLDHLVGERLRARDHLARVEEQAHEVGRVAVQRGASSWMVLPRGTTISPSGTGAVSGVSVGADAGPSSSRLRRRRFLRRGR